ncbi:hypothetical protein FACS1894200_10790 [Spirochaetia bacterium]|nr:hypothetical protein FACS1894200_10790 [Spirochaetia bacterium]
MEKKMNSFVEELNLRIDQYLSGKASVHDWIDYMRDNGCSESQIGSNMDALLTDYPAIADPEDPSGHTLLNHVLEPIPKLIF